MNPEISIVTPAYNAAKYLEESIASVLAQTFSSWEMIIVDDGSKDNTADIARGFLTNPKIRLLQQENKGVSAARNTGIAEAKGKYIAFLDADDCFVVDNLQRKYDVLNGDPSLDFVYSDVMKCDNNLKELFIERGVEADNLFEDVLLWKGETIPGFSSNVMIKASQMKGKIQFDVNLSNCADRYMKILLSKHLKGYHINEALVKYRDSPGSMSKKVELLEHDENYIISQIKKQNIVPSGSFRKRVIANIYMILAGSWYTNANKPLKAIKYGIKAALLNPSVLSRLAKKAFK